MDCSLKDELPSSFTLNYNSIRLLLKVDPEIPFVVCVCENNLICERLLRNNNKQRKHEIQQECKRDKVDVGIADITMCGNFIFIASFK